MLIFSFRAECDRDVEEIKKSLSKLDDTVSFVLVPNYLVGSLINEPTVEFISTLDLETIQKAIGQIEDCHVALQTLRPVPLSENTLERNHSIWYK